MTKDGKLLPFIGEFVLPDDEPGLTRVVFRFDGKWDRASELSQLNVAVCEIRIWHLIVQIK